MAIGHRVGMGWDRFLELTPTDRHLLCDALGEYLEAIYPADDVSDG